MKYLPYKILFILLLIGIFLGYSSCKRCSDVQVITHDKFLAYYNGLMRFEGHEVLTFLKNKKDTVHFIGQGLNSYFTMTSLPGGDCEIDHKLLNHEVTFTNSTEGSLFFHYYYDEYTRESYEIKLGAKQLINPIGAYDLFELPWDTNLVILGHKYETVRKFGSTGGDSIYINTSFTDIPNLRNVRMKINKDIYEVIP